MVGELGHGWLRRVDSVLQAVGSHRRALSRREVGSSVGELAVGGRGRSGRGIGQRRQVVVLWERVRNGLKQGHEDGEGVCEMLSYGRMPIWAALWNLRAWPGSP